MKRHMKLLAGMAVGGLLALPAAVAQSQNPSQTPSQYPSSRNPSQGPTQNPSQNPRQDPTMNPGGMPTQEATQGTQTRSNKHTGTANRLTMDDTFATKAAQGGLAEVQLGTLAKEHASSPDVKSFGEQMVNDHTKANDELKSLASKNNITLPTSLSAKDQAMYDKLSKLNGVEFDRAYMKMMVSDHKTDVSEFKKESNSGTDPNLKAFASKTLPTLEQHLQMAQSVEAKIKNEKSSGNADRTQKSTTSDKH